VATRAKKIVAGVRAKSTRPRALSSPPKLIDGEAINPKTSQHRQAQRRSLQMQKQTNRVRGGLR
jgi:hypothetical protein